MDKKKRTRLVRPYPPFPLAEALAVPKAIHEANADMPMDRKSLAEAMGTTARSSAFIMKLRASAGYGLTTGGHSDPEVSITDLGLAAIAPSDPDEGRRALREAALKPDIFARFYELLDGKRLPEDRYAVNLVQRRLAVRPELAQECLEFLKQNGVLAGILKREPDGGWRVILSSQAARDGVDRGPVGVPAGALAQATPPEGAAKETPPEGGDTVERPVSQERGRPRTTAEGRRARDGGPRSLAIVLMGVTDPPAWLRRLTSALGVRTRVVMVDEPQSDGRPGGVPQVPDDCGAAVLVAIVDGVAVADGPETAAERRGTMVAGVMYQAGVLSALCGARVVVVVGEGTGDIGLPRSVPPVVVWRGDGHDTAWEVLEALVSVGGLEISVP